MTRDYGSELDNLALNGRGRAGGQCVSEPEGAVPRGPTSRARRRGAVPPGPRSRASRRGAAPPGLRTEERATREGGAPKSAPQASGNTARATREGVALRRPGSAQGK